MFSFIWCICASNDYVPLQFRFKKCFKFLSIPETVLFFSGFPFLPHLPCYMCNPAVFMYDRTERPEACMVQSLFQENEKFVFMYIRTVYCIELLIVCLIYFHLTRKIRHLMVSVSPVVNNAGMNSLDIPPSANHNINDIDNRNVETQEQTVGISSQKKAPKLQGNGKGLAWKIRAFKVTQATILATVHQWLYFKSLDTFNRICFARELTCCM